MVRPVARANLSRISLRVAAAWGEACAMIRVSSAYYSTVGGQSVYIGWHSWPGEKALKIRR